MKDDEISIIMNKLLLSLCFLSVVILSFSCSTDKKDDLSKYTAESSLNRINISKTAVHLDLTAIKLPGGFTITVWAPSIPGARSLARSEEGIVFVGNRKKGKVYAIIDENNDGKADYRYTIAKGLDSPNGVAYKDGDLFVAEKQRILKFADIKNNLANPSFDVIYDGYPNSKQHGHKFIAFGPDGYLYIPVGAPCNICNPDNDIFASITRIDVDADSIKPEIVARGVRNTVGFDWDPSNQNLWFTDNGRDMLGDDIPSCELNKSTAIGQHFGYPYWHAGGIKDPEFGDAGKGQTAYVAPQVKLGPHVAPLGMRFYKGSMFPKNYRKAIFIAEHGSWNRSRKIGYNITAVTLNGNGDIEGKKTFAEGWLDDTSQEVWGRPVDVLELQDGSLLVSDDKADCIYRISYQAR